MAHEDGQTYAPPDTEATGNHTAFLIVDLTPSLAAGSFVLTEPIASTVYPSLSEIFPGVNLEEPGVRTRMMRVEWMRPKDDGSDYFHYGTGTVYPVVNPQAFEGLLGKALSQKITSWTGNTWQRTKGDGRIIKIAEGKPAPKDISETFEIIRAAFPIYAGSLDQDLARMITRLIPLPGSDALYPREKPKKKSKEARVEEHSDDTVAVFSQEIQEKKTLEPLSPIELRLFFAAAAMNDRGEPIIRTMNQLLARLLNGKVLSDRETVDYVDVLREAHVSLKAKLERILLNDEPGEEADKIREWAMGNFGESRSASLIDFLCRDFPMRQTRAQRRARPGLFHDVLPPAVVLVKRHP
jgi:hypothetical protein